jgi:rhodanese-related sulfurtransferase
LCHIHGSVNIPMGELMQRLEGMDRGRAIVVICHHGMRSLQVATYLDGAGFADVANLDGGVAAWSRDVDPGMPQY